MSSLSQYRRWRQQAPDILFFGEYVGAHWCGPCMSSASPSLDNLKTSNPEDFTYISFFESSSGGWPSDGPINRMSHVTASSSGYPTFSFADQQSGACYKVGAGGTNFYDPEYSAGGCMDMSSNDFQLKLTMSLDSSTNDVTITLESKYVGVSVICKRLRLRRGNREGWGRFIRQWSQATSQLEIMAPR